MRLKEKAMYTLQTLSWSALFLLISGCKPETPFVPADLEYEYFPLEVGRTLVYTVDSVTYDDFFDPVKVDSVSLQQRELYESTYLDNEDRESYRIEVHQRKADSLPWKPSHTYAANLTQSTAQRVEDNLRFIKLLFPPTKGKVWKGNAYIDAADDLAYLKDWEYEIVSSGEPYSVNGVSYPNTVSVLQIDELNAIEQRYGFEVYAKDVGLIYQKLIKLDRPNDPFGDWESGFVVEKRLLSHGL